MDEVAQPEPLLLISTSSAGAAASVRVMVWRKLRSLGALYLQQSVCLLPARPPIVRQVQRLAGRVRAEGGTAQVYTITVPDPAEYADLVGQFNAARDAEYGEVCERTPELLAELATETARGRATYAEVEESEADLQRFRAWLAKITARDHFGAPGRGAAVEAVEACARALTEFETAALHAETGPEPSAEPAGSAPAPGGAEGRRPRRRTVPATDQPGAA
ncbi:Chromate resistance protein ChrB [Dactylosporangium sp. NPDC051485]|uniref:Chromate resistance protein ChrB n=1 Tax=Dactylosporangium sp. NPDC051485 TaxID=3154846 RepID=UPI003412FD88